MMTFWPNSNRKSKHEVHLKLMFESTEEGEVVRLFSKWNGILCDDQLRLRWMILPRGFGKTLKKMFRDSIDLSTAIASQVLWDKVNMGIGKRGPEFTWEHEDQMRIKYPHLFDGREFLSLLVNLSEEFLNEGYYDIHDLIRKEAPVNFLTDPLEGRSTLRPADILVFGWAGGKHACVDLTGVSPLVGLRDNGFVAGQAALKAESSKVAKHEKACLENQHVFIPFAFDTFGFLAPEAEEFLNRVQRVVQSNFSTPKTQNFIFSRIGFAIQKGVAAQLVARLPAILL
ncbi:hypothetical protein Tco_0307699 [Tanacetum coccineum]